MVNPVKSKKQRYFGFTLVELIAFMVAMGIIGAGLLVGMNQAQKGSGLPRLITEANFLANARMQIILMNRKIKTFANLDDPCTYPTPPDICQPITGYASSNNFQVTSNISVIDSSTKMIVVTVNDANNATIYATITTSISNYG